MIRFALLPIFLILSFGVASAFAGESEDLFQQGLAAYHSKQYKEASERFQKLIDQGQASPALLNNMALSVYALDQKPLALAFWRKALSMRPGFLPAVKGRDLLENKMQMRPLERDSFALWLHRTLESLSLQILLWVAAIFLALAGWFGLGYWGERTAALDEERPLPPFPTAATLLLAVFLSALAATGLKIKDDWATRATVVLPKVSARSLPADDGVGLFDLSGGSEVFVRQTHEGWTQVQNSEGSSGWVKNSDILVTN